MGLFSLFRRWASSAPVSPQPVEAADSVQDTRARARRRLIGAFALVVVGVIGFPLVFETQPRPIPVDIPIEVPRKEGLSPLVMPQARVTPPAPTTPAAIPATKEAPASAPAASSSPAVVAVIAQPRQVSPAAPAAAPKMPPPSAVAPKSERASTPPIADASRARALLDGKDANKAIAPKDGVRYVVQVGAFAENTAAHETRQKVEKLGLKTYAQVADTEAGKRIRVRVGPFAGKEDAEQARSRLKAAGFPAVLLTL
jgi:DedD protein